MATTVTLDSEIVQAIQQATGEKDKAAAVHMALLISAFLMEWRLTLASPQTVFL